MPKRPCISSGCPNYAEYRGRCSACARQNDKSIRRAGKDIYRTKRWELTRRKKLTENPICERCGEELANTVHHITDLAEGGEPFAMQNLESLGASCHSKETRARQLA